MLFGIITLFPEMFSAITRYGVISKFIRNGVISINYWNPREYVNDQNKKVDDRPYGGGVGMLMLAQPLKKVIDKARSILGHDSKVIYLSPQGRRLNQKLVFKFANNNKNLILICGRYQGIDERLIMMEVDEEWSIGDYVLSGGELAAMVLIDSIVRVLPGNVLNNKSLNIRSDSFIKNRLDCPYYTRPRDFKGLKVPEILLSGNHSAIVRWKIKQSLGNTWLKRPDLLKKSQLTKEEKKLLMEFKDEYLLSLSINKFKKRK